MSAELLELFALLNQGNKAPADSTETIRKLLAANPSVAKERGSETDGTYIGGRQLPLHEALYRNNSVPTETCLVILQAYPAAAKEAGWFDRLPLHFAAVSKKPPEVVRALLKANPDAVKVHSTGYPLQHAASHNAPRESVLALLEAWPPAAKCMDSFEQTPAHVAKKYGYEEIAQLIESFEPAAAIRKFHAPPIGTPPPWP